MRRPASRFRIRSAPALFLAAFLPGIVPGHAAPEDSPCLPISPKKILEILPDPPKGWELKRSEAQHSLAHWLTCTAVREYARIPEKGSPAPETPVSVRLRITDTARHPEYTGVFADFSAGKGENSESLYIDSHPAVITDLEASGQLVDILIAKRFIVSFTFRGESIDSLGEWLRTVKVSALTAAPGAAIDRLPPRGNLVRIDELRPERDYSRETMLITAAELEKQQAEDDKREAEAARQGKAPGIVD